MLAFVDETHDALGSAPEVRIEGLLDYSQVVGPFFGEGVDLFFDGSLLRLGDCLKGDLPHLKVLDVGKGQLEESSDQDQLNLLISVRKRLPFSLHVVCLIDGQIEPVFHLQEAHVHTLLQATRGVLPLIDVHV